MSESESKEQQSVEAAPTDYRHDLAGQGIGAYSGNSPHGEPGAGSYGGGRGTDYSPSEGSSLAEQPNETTSTPDPALADQMGAGSGERSAHDPRGAPDFGRKGRSINAPRSQGPLSELWDEDVPPKDPHAYDEEDAARWRAGREKPAAGT